MDHAISKLLIATAVTVATTVLPVAACQHTAERVVEPPGGPDASPQSPEVGDSGATPIGPIARPPAVDDTEPENFRLVHAPEFGALGDLKLAQLNGERQGGFSGGDNGGYGGFSGADSRPVGCSGGAY